MSNKQKPTAAVKVAKEKQNEKSDGIITLSTGVDARLKPVAASLVQAVTSQIEDPEVPIWHDEAKGRDIPNPSDPTYLSKLQKTMTDRALAAIDAMVMFGVEMVDGVPDDGWDKKLKYLEKMGHIDLSDFDLKDEMDREFLYKRYVAVGSDDLVLISAKSGVRPEDVAAAEASFPSDEGGNSN